MSRPWVLRGVSCFNQNSTVTIVNNYGSRRGVGSINDSIVELFRIRVKRRSVNWTK